MAQVIWTITGGLKVEEKEVSGLLEKRPLANVEVEILASNFGKFDLWGTTHTDANGNFTFKKEKDKSKRKIKVRVRFEDSTLAINSGLLGNPLDFLKQGIIVFEHEHEVEGPTINTGTLYFKTSGKGELGELNNIRQATAWYACKTLVNALPTKDPYFTFKNKIRVIYPAFVPSQQCYANNLTNTAYIHTAEWDIETVFHEVMHLWNYQHNHGIANWFGAIFSPLDLNTHSQEERRPIAFHEGFASFAAKELMYELWGKQPGSNRTKGLPYNRYALVRTLHLDTIDELEQNDKGVYRALCLLTCNNLYTLKFGNKNTYQTTDPYPQEIDNASTFICPNAPILTIWDVLKVFQANPGAGYSTEWQVGNKDFGIRRFLERATDVLTKLDESTKNLLLSLMDPNMTEEPQSRCTPIKITDTRTSNVIFNKMKFDKTVIAQKKVEA